MDIKLGKRRLGCVSTVTFASDNVPDMYEKVNVIKTKTKA